MGTQKKKQDRSISAVQPRKLREGLDQAQEYIQDFEPDLALQLLRKLDQKYPNKPDVLSLMLSAYSYTGDIRGHLRTAHKLQKLIPNKPDVNFSLAAGYMENGYLALSLRTFRQFIRRWPDHHQGDDARKAIKDIESVISNIYQELGPLHKTLDFLCRYDDLRIQKELGNFNRSRKLGADLLEERPQFAPVFNSLSLVEWSDGNILGAIELCLKVLEFEPENVHALANLTRYAYLRGDEERAKDFAQKLKQSKAHAANIWTAKAQAFSFIKDDKAVLALLEQARKANAEEELTSWFMHYCAVGAYRLGDEKMARRYWHRSIEYPVQIYLAEVNLEELEKPAYERICPQVFGIGDWLPDKKLLEIEQIISKYQPLSGDQILRDKLTAYIEANSEIIHFFSHALSAGDVKSREILMQLVFLTGQETLLSKLKDFVFRKDGPDSLRLEASQVLTKYGIFKNGETIEVWLEGELEPVIMMRMNVSYIPENPTRYKQSVQKILEQAIYALRDQNGEKAEPLLRRALQLHGDDPGIRYNLAVSLSLQGRENEADEIGADLPERYPDYFFGKIITVKKAIYAGKLDEARELLDRMVERTNMHITEFRALCSCKVNLSIADSDFQTARLWIELWKQVAKDDPEIEYFENRINLLEALEETKDLFPKSGSKKRRGKK